MDLFSFFLLDLGHKIGQSIWILIEAWPCLLVIAIVMVFLKVYYRDAFLKWMP